MKNSGRGKRCSAFDAALMVLAAHKVHRIPLLVWPRRRNVSHPRGQIHGERETDVKDPKWAVPQDTSHRVDGALSKAAGRGRKGNTRDRTLECDACEDA